MDNKPAHESLRQMTLLYVEDEDAIREEVAYFLARRVKRLITAGNGEAALKLFHDERPDLVLSDIQMPLMNGLEMASKIKSTSPDTPVIVATAFNDTQYMQTAISIGIDGYVLKPINLEQLMQVILRNVEALLRMRELTESRAQLSAYHRAAEDERRLVADLMARMMRPENLKDRQLHYWLHPTELVGGDLIAAARSRNNKLYVMLADSTGHGLPAALNLLPVNHIFYSMVSKNLPIPTMAEEMNWAVHDQSPRERYVAALLACIDFHNHLIEVWNGGLPSALLLGDGGEVVHKFESANFPLGILDRTFVAETEVFQWSGHGQLVMYSDGLEDAEDANGVPFGGERILATLRHTPKEARFQALIDTVTAHLGGRNAFDDMTLLMVDTEPQAQPARLTAT